MTKRVRVAGAIKTVTANKLVIGGAVRQIKSKRVLTPAGMKSIAEFSTALSVGVSPDTVFGSNMGGASATSGYATATIAGGTAPYTILWQMISNTGGTVYAESPSLASTRFIQSTEGLLGPRTAVFRVTVTDALGATAQDTVTAQFTHTDTQ